jgi:hypothetical protein
MYRAANVKCRDRALSMLLSNRSQMDRSCSGVGYGDQNCFRNAQTARNLSGEWPIHNVISADQNKGSHMKHSQCYPDKFHRSGHKFEKHQT